MSRPARTAAARRLHARRADLTPSELVRHLAEDGDPLGLAPIAHAVWGSRALLVPPSLLHLRACHRIAVEFQRLPRDTPWAQWLQRQVETAAEELLRTEPLDWRDVRTQPTPFEQSVGSCFGVHDTLVPRLVRAFHALPLEERRAVHALLPRALLGLTAVSMRRDRCPARRARETARRATLILRQLLAELRREPD